MSITRLPDFYYTTKNLDGQPKQEGIKSPPPMFAQGEDVIFNILLYLDGQPVDATKLKLEVIIKKNPYASNILWYGEVGSGLYPKLDNVPGYFQIWMPASVSGQFLPGTYYLDIKATEKVGEGAGIKDRVIRLYTVLFDITLEAMSPEPKLRPVTRVETSYDPASGETTTTLTSVEPTVPYPVDTTQKTVNTIILS